MMDIKEVLPQPFTIFFDKKSRHMSKDTATGTGMISDTVFKN